MKFQNAGPTYGNQPNVNVTEIAFSIHEDVDASFYDVLYPGYEFSKWVMETQFRKNINQGATSYGYITRDKRGTAAFIGNGQNDNIPMVAQSAGAVNVPIGYSAVGSRISKEDARQYHHGFNGTLSTDLGEAMRRACDNLLESTLLFGNEDLRFEPLLNNPAVTTATSSSPWASATGEEILADINNALRSLWEDSRTLFVATDIYLPLAAFSLLTTKPMVLGGVNLAQTIAQYLKANNIASEVSGRALNIHASRYLGNAGAGGVSRMVVIDRNPDYQVVPFPLPYQLDAPIPVALGAEWYAEMKFGPYHLRQPGSVMYVDGI